MTSKRSRIDQKGADEGFLRESSKDNQPVPRMKKKTRRKWTIISFVMMLVGIPLFLTSNVIFSDYSFPVFLVGWIMALIGAFLIILVNSD